MDETLLKLQNMSIGKNPKKSSSSYSTYYHKSTHSSENLRSNDTDLNEDVRAISNGRYGCALFLKVCGTPRLKQQSLGRLA